MISRIRSRLAFIARNVLLPPAVFCVATIFSFCNATVWSWIPWCCLISKKYKLSCYKREFFNKLPLIMYCCSKFSFTLIEWHRYHIASLQVFKLLSQISAPSLHRIFTFQEMWQEIISLINRNRLFIPRVFTNFSKRSFFIKGLYMYMCYKTVQLAIKCFSGCHVHCAITYIIKNLRFNSNWFLCLYVLTFVL